MTNMEQFNIYSKYMLLHILLSTISATLALVAITTLFIRIRDKPKEDTDIDIQRSTIYDKESRLGKTYLTQYKILDAKSTASTLYNSMCLNEDLEGNVKKLNSFYET